MKEERQNINDLYSYMEFDKHIQNSWKSTILDKNEWINFQDEENTTHSLLLYRKGNHTAFSNLFESYYSSNSNRSFAPMGNANWYIPYKDPVDKLIGGYFSSQYWAEEDHQKFKGKRHDFYDELEPYVIDFINDVLKGDFIYSKRYDMHMTPLSVLLEQALIDRPKFLLSRLVGLDLDTQRDIWPCVYAPVIQKQDNISEEFLRLFTVRRSPYGDQLRYYISKFKYIHVQKIKQLVDGPLYNEYKLLEFFKHQMYYKNKMING